MRSDDGPPKKSTFWATTDAFPRIAGEGTRPVMVTIQWDDDDPDEVETAEAARDPKDLPN